METDKENIEKQPLKYGWYIYEEIGFTPINMTKEAYEELYGKIKVKIDYIEETILPKSIFTEKDFKFLDLE